MLSEAIVKEELDRYELAFRAWAQQEPVVAEGVRRVDEARFRFVRGLFGALGFKGAGQELRARIYISYMTVQEGILVSQSKRQKLRRVRHLHALLMRPT